ncbi:hypothetical protein DID88_007969 [Monilinia fructigena]|uniref:CPAF-like PDZ domain-containing protein n=1 Tax=Monilinia fructigena TaxID=38457 RepID=A0A395J3Y1_9HELO|nr:hypothetical protein DID88_007969 [Monilinia fructigena]
MDLSLPKVFFKIDLDQARNNATFTPSAVSKINDQDANMFLQKTAQTLSAYNDPDATYNQLFFSPAFDATGSGEVYRFGQVLGFTSDFYNYTFENGTTRKFRNIATAKISFEGIDSGKALFDTINPPISTITQSTTTSTTTTTSAQVITTTTSLIGYPTPIVMHRDGYTSGYFLPNSDVAVLAIQSFLDPADTDPDAPRIQSEVVASFLSSCLKNKKTKLIVDVQGNGGGALIEGYDVFQRIFPGLETFGASRMRNSEVLEFFGDVYTANLKPEDNPDANGQFEAQAYLDVNGKPLVNWSALDPPEKIYNDSFTAQIRFNLKYWTNDMPRNGSLTLGPQVFEIVMGGRPQTGPMQGVAGSKGSEVLTFGQIDEIPRSNRRRLIGGSAGKGTPSSNNDASTPNRRYAALSNTTLPASISKSTGTGSESGPKPTSAGHNTITNGTTVAPITGEAMVLGDSWWVSALGDSWWVSALVAAMVVLVV